MPRPLQPVHSRILRNISIDENRCWIWQLRINRKGYGCIRIKRTDGTWTMRGVHRVAWEVLVGSVPEGMEIDHLCRVRACCNPHHMEVVTSRENSLRSEPATRAHCVNGHAYAEYGAPRKGKPLKDGTQPNHRACKVCMREWSRRRDAKCRELLKSDDDVS